MKAVHVDTFGGPEVLTVQDIPEPHAGSGEVRVRVTAVGLNPMDWMLSSMPELAHMFHVTLPSGFGHDFAGVIDEVGEDVQDFAVGDRVFGGVMARALAEYIIINPGGEALLHTPSGVSDVSASAFFIPGLTADAALHAIDVTSGDTVLIGGAAGGVGIFAVQLAKIAGATVIGTGSSTTVDYLRELGVVPVTYGAGLAERVRALAPDGITAATSLIGTETIDVALELGVKPDRISAIAAGPHPPQGIRATSGSEATPGALERIADAVAAGNLTVPIAKTFPIDQIQEAVSLQQEGHVHGKIIITLNS